MKNKKRTPSAIIHSGRHPHLFLLQKHAVLFFEALVKIAALAEAHGDVKKTILAFETVLVGDDVGMLESGEQFGLLLRRLALLRRRCGQIDFLQDVLFFVEAMLHEPHFAVTALPNYADAIVIG